VAYWTGASAQAGSALLNFNTTNNGNLLIGTTVNPASNGSGLAIYSTSFPRISLRNSTTTDVTGVGMEFYMVGLNMFYDLKGANNQTWTSNATERMRLWGSTGNLLLQNGGTFSDSGERLQVTGTMKVTGDVTINTVSIGLGNSSISTNTRVGVTTLNAITTGGFNTAIGFDSQRFTTTGGSNTSLGYYAARQNQGGGSNTAIGRSALQDNQSGNQNTALGNNAAFSNTSASFNSVIGSEALYNNTTGASNIAFGYRAGRYLSGGATFNTISNSSIFIGAETKANADNETNQIVIGHQAIGGGSNSVTIGNTSITKTILRGTINAANLPTSSTGLATGDLWNDAGTIKIV
jgi:hypothetical protein